MDMMKEIEDELRQERMAELWKKCGPWVITACVLDRAGHRRRGGVAEPPCEAQQGALTGELLSALVEKDSAKQAQALDALAQAHPDTPQAAMARMQRAAAEKPEAALALYTAAADDATRTGGTARPGPHPGHAQSRRRARRRIAAAACRGNKAAPSPRKAKEADAWKLLADGQRPAALAAFQSLAADVTTPQGIRARAGSVAAYLTPEEAK